MLDNIFKIFGFTVKISKGKIRIFFSGFSCSEQTTFQIHKQTMSSSISLSLLLQLICYFRFAGAFDWRSQDFAEINSKIRKRFTSSLHPTHLKVTIQDEHGVNTVHLSRRDNINVNSPLCVQDNGEMVCETGTQRDVAFYHATNKIGAFGVKINDITNPSRKSFDGVLVSNDHAHIVEPASKLSHVFVNQSSHYITKRSSAFVASGRTIRVFGRQMVNIAESPNYINDHVIEQAEENTSDYVVEVLVIIDNSLYKKFLEKVMGKESEALTQIRYYFAHIVNGMDLRYSSINKTDFSLSIRLAGFFVAKNDTDLPFIITFRQGRNMRSKVDGSTTLLGLTNFLKRKTNLPHYDHAMLFTEYDATNGRGHILGTSYLSGICTSMSTSVIVDHGSYNSAGIAAHELGHNLGVIYHDGDTALVTRRCPKELNYIMAPSSAIISRQTKEYSFKFSDCSIEQIERQLRNLSNRNKNCLAEDPGPSLATVVIKPYLMIPPGQIEDVHTQCKEVYGNTSFMCPPSTPDEMCYKMYCYDPKRNICITASEQRAAMGSSCGNKKWCKLGTCVKDDKAPSVPEDCPFPDVPPTRTNCREQASPFRCKDRNFYKRCCESCNKNFTEEEACRDMKVLINGLKCSQFIKKYGTNICSIDPNVMNFCCKSCSLSRISTAPPTENNVETLTSSCMDNAFVRINGLDCHAFIAQNTRNVCDRKMISTHCCASCYS